MIVGEKRLRFIIREEISRELSLRLMRESRVPDIVSYEDMEVIRRISSKQDRMLRRGSKGSRVGQLQRILMSLGYELPRYSDDEDFGGETRDAVRKLQRDFGLKDDGVVGPDTAEAMINAHRGLSYPDSQETDDTQQLDIEIPTAVKDPSADRRALLVGDSQMGGAIGRALEDLVISRGWSPIRVPRGGAGNSPAGKNRFYKWGAQPSYWMRGASSRSLFDAIDANRPSLIIVNLGGNGPTQASSFYRALQDHAPEAEIIWIGAPPPVTPSGGSSDYVNTGSPSREVSQYSRTREGYNEEISSVVGGNFVDPYESEHLSSRDRNPGDGVHVRDPYASSFVSSEVGHLV